VKTVPGMSGATRGDRDVTVTRRALSNFAMPLNRIEVCDFKSYRLAWFYSLIIFYCLA